MNNDIEKLFSIASKKTVNKEDEYTFTSIIKHNSNIINSSSEDVFMYGEDCHLLDIALETNNDYVIEELLTNSNLLEIKNPSNLLFSLSKYNNSLETFIKIFNLFIKKSLSEDKIYIENSSFDYNSVEKIINLIISNNSNYDILFYVLKEYHERSFVLINDDIFNYDYISQFYLKNEDHFNVLNLLDNSVEYYSNKKIKQNITNGDLLNIEKIIFQKREEYMFLLKNESVYQKLLPSYQKVFFKKMDYLIIDIFKLCCFSPELLQKNDSFFNDLDNHFVLILVESIFKKRNFLNSFDKNDIIQIATFLNNKIKDDFKFTNDFFSQNQIDLINSIFSFNNNGAYYTFFEHFNLHINDNRIYYFDSFFYKKQDCSIDHIIKLIELHKIKNIDSPSNHNIVLSNILSLFEDKFGENGDFNILKPILKIIKPTFVFQEKLEEDNIHFFIKYNNSCYLKDLISFYKPSISTILSAIIDLNRRNHPFYSSKNIFNHLFNYINQFSINKDVIKESSYILNNYPFSKMNADDKRNMLIEIENYKINYNLKANIGINDEDMNKKGKKRL